MEWIFLCIAVCAEVAGTAALKASQGFTKLVPSAIVIVGYGVAFYFLSLTLDKIPVGIAYALWSGIGIVLISIVGWVFLDQKLDLAAGAGMAFIVVGVAVINLLSTSVPH
jgi:small multidrug resistance pump